MTQPMAPSATLAEGLSVSARRIAVPSILLGTFLGNLDASIANVALPTIARDLVADPASTVWVVNAYQLIFAMAVLPLAALGEKLGYRRVFLLGVAGFTLASLGCALAPSLSWLVAARVVQGLCGACMSTIVPALLRMVFPPHMGGRAISLLALTVALSTAAGPSVAAVILTLGDWRWLFAINLPIGLVALGASYRFLPRTPGAERRIDVPGALLNAATLALIIIGLGHIGEAGHHGVAALQIALGLIVAVVLVRHQRSRQTPLLPLDLMRVPVLALSSLTSVACYMAQTLAYVGMPFLLQHTFARSEAATGLLITPWPLVIVFIAPLAGRLSDRFDSARMSALGLGMFAVGLASLAWLPADASDWGIAWRMVICGVGFGFFQTPNNRIIMMGAPRERSGAASGLMTMARTVGMTLGAAVVALLFDLYGDHGAHAAMVSATILAALGGGVSLLRVRAKARAG
ncbi:MFS transporter [Pandoraea commovens]|uniref:MFS transporter n=1 Tax=Pandoraea commovens TaxID=2508289 RepID=A0ABY5QG36_9BURK|nr:MFS transporter [Pandoraea commovens]UVA79776.1 MFS transporter [Pandoraea commovens]